MSLELSIFSERHVYRQALGDKMAQRGWGIRFVDDGILGWCTAWAATPGSDLRQLPSTHYAVVGFRETAPDRDSLDELAGRFRRLAARLRESSALTIVWTSAGRTSLGRSLQRGLWRAMGELAGGLLFDEVSGDLVRPEAVENELPPAGPELPPDAGIAAPDFTLQRQDGKSFWLGQYRGQPVTLWFLPDCDAPYAQLEGQSLSLAQEAIKKRTILVMLGPFPAARSRDYAARFGLRVPVLAHAEYPVAAYDCHQQRLTVVVGADGKIRDRRERGGDGASSGRELLKRWTELQLW
jgi:peroxiredoxin